MGWVLLILGLIAFGLMIVLSAIVRRPGRMDSQSQSDYRPEEMDVQSRPPFF